jgi:hypothetical protein
MTGLTGGRGWSLAQGLKRFGGSRIRPTNRVNVFRETVELCCSSLCRRLQVGRNKGGWATSKVGEWSLAHAERGIEHTCVACANA